MVRVKKEGVILKPTQLGFENQAVLNPTCIQKGNKVHMFYRAVRKGNHSTIGYCELDGPLKVKKRLKKPIFEPEHDYEKHGVEDPRIIYFRGIYYLFYVAYDGKNAITAYATSKDMKTWKKKGTITPKITYDEAEDIFRESRSSLKEKYFFFESYYKDVVAKDVLLWEKDAFLIPKKFNGKYALIHRILPEIQIIYFDNFKQLHSETYWKEYLKKLGEYVMLEPVHGYESRNIGGGAPLIETSKGWLMIYHAVEDTNAGKRYHASAALFDKKNPQKAIGHLCKPLFSPSEEYELHGDVPKVVFPTATTIFGERLYIYYGAADKCIAVASVNLNELLDELQHNVCSIEDSEISVAAGQVYHASKEGITLKDLKKTIKKDEKIIIMAIGWLVKEGKVTCSYSGKEMEINTID